MSAPSTFLAFWQLGYRRLIPIIPPDAQIGEKSSLFKRVGTHQDGRGKTPGVRGQGGKWYGFDWIEHEADEENCRRWQHIGAGIGIKTGEGLIAIDADTLSEDYARTIRDIVERHVGRTPVRVGRYPKALYLLRVSEPLRYTRVEFGERDDKGKLKERVEILSDGKQFVAHGIHPATSKPYTWPHAPVPFDELPIYPAAAIVAMMEDLRRALPAASEIISEGAAANVDQAALRGDIEKVRRAVELIPNTSEHFPSRESYTAIGYAIKAALPDHLDEAFNIFAEWCERWTDGVNEPEIVEADWARMKPPFRRGANWIYELAERHAPKQFDRAEVWFEPISAADVSAFDVAAERDRKADNEEREKLEPIAWINPADWIGAEPPKRKWIVTGMIPDGEVTLLTGKGGVGKTLLAQQLGTCVAQGLPFLGHDVQQCRVMGFLCEDAPDELHIRQKDINAALCQDMTDIAPNLRIASRKYMDNLLAVFDRNTSSMKRTAVWRQLVEDAKAFGAKLVIVDTIADTFGGSEIDRAQVRQYVQACLGKLAQEIGGAVLALGHPSRAGESSGDGTSGSTAWHASVRSRLYLEHATKDGAGPMRRLSNKKANYGPAGDEYMLRWARGAFDLVSAKRSAVVEAGGAVAGATGAAGAAKTGGAVVSVTSMADALDDALLAAVRHLEAEGVETSLARNSPYWAPKVLMSRCAELLGFYRVEEVEAGLIRAVEAGRVREAVVGRKANRHPRMGLSTVPLIVALTGHTHATGIDERHTETPPSVFQ